MAARERRDHEKHPAEKTLEDEEDYRQHVEQENDMRGGRTFEEYHNRTDEEKLIDDVMGDPDDDDEFADGGTVGVSTRIGKRFDAVLAGPQPSGDPSPAGDDIEDVGTVVGDKRRLSDADRLKLLQSQIEDPARDPGSDAELFGEIKRLQNTMGRAKAPAPRRASAMDRFDAALDKEVAAPAAGDATPLEDRTVEAQLERAAAEHPARATASPRGGIRVEQPDQAGVGESEPNAPWTGEGGVLTQTPAGFVAQSKNAIARFLEMHARQGEQNLRTQQSQEDQSLLDTRDIRARAAKSPSARFDAAIARVDLPPAELQPLIDDATKAGERAQQWAHETKREIELVTPPDMSMFQKMVWSAVTSSGPTAIGIGVGIATRNPTLAMALMAGGGYAQQAGDAYGEAIEQGVSHRTAMRSAMRQGLVETLDAIPIGYALSNPATRRTFANFIGKTLKTAGVEGGTEGVQQILQDFDAFASYNPKMTLGEAWENFVVAVGAGFITGVVIGGAGHAREPTRDELIAKAIEEGVAGSEWTKPAEEVARERLRPENAQVKMGAKKPAAGPAEAFTPTNRLDDGTEVAPKMEDGKPAPGVWVDADGTLHEAERAEPIQKPEPNASFTSGGVEYPVTVTGEGSRKGSVRLADGQEISIARLNLEDEAKEILGLLPPEEQAAKKAPAKAEAAAKPEPKAPEQQATPAAAAPKEGPAAPVGGEKPPPPRGSSRLEPEPAGPPVAEKDVIAGNLERVAQDDFAAEVDRAIKVPGKVAYLHLAYDSEGRIAAVGQLEAMPEDVRRQIMAKKLMRATLRVDPENTKVLGVNFYNISPGADKERLEKSLVGQRLKAREPSEKELANRERMRKKWQRDAKERKAIDVERDSLIPAIIKLGGINILDRLDTVGDDKEQRGIPGVGFLFTKTGTGLDDLVTKLVERGYMSQAELDDPKDTGGTRLLVDRIRAELGGQDQYWSLHRSDQAMADQEQADQELADDMQELSGDAPLEMDIAPEELEGNGVEPTAESLVISDLLSQLSENEAERMIMQYADAPENEFIDALKARVQEKTSGPAKDQEAAKRGERGEGKAAQRRGRYTVTPAGRPAVRGAGAAAKGEQLRPEERPEARNRLEQPDGEYDTSAAAVYDEITAQMADGHGDATNLSNDQIGAFTGMLTREGWTAQKIGKSITWSKGEWNLFIRSQGQQSTAIVQWYKQEGSAAKRSRRQVQDELKALLDKGDARQLAAKDESIRALRPTAAEWLSPEEHERYLQLHAELAPLEREHNAGAAERVKAKRAARVAAANETAEWAKVGDPGRWTLVNGTVDFTAHEHPVLAVPCPDCGVKVDVWCKRPSGHKAMDLHARRKKLADEIHAAQGDPEIVNTSLDTTEPKTFGHGIWKYGKAMDAPFAPHPYPRNDDQKHPVRVIVHGIKENKDRAIKTAAREMAQDVKATDVLVPVPGRFGKAEAGVLNLAKEIARLSGARLAPVLHGRFNRESQYERKKRGEAPLRGEEFGMHIVGERPKGRIWLVDNVIGTGETMKAALAVFPADAIPLVYASARELELTPAPAADKVVPKVGPEEQAAAIRDRDTAVLTPPEGTAPPAELKPQPTGQPTLFGADELPLTPAKPKGTKGDGNPNQGTLFQQRARYLLQGQWAGEPVEGTVTWELAPKKHGTLILATAHIGEREVARITRPDPKHIGVEIDGWNWNDGSSVRVIPGSHSLQRAQIIAEQILRPAATLKVTSDVDEAATDAKGHEASEAQQDAGNYAKGHVQLGPEGATMEGSIENEAGTSRRPEWPPLKDHYGQLLGTAAFDKDLMDFFIAPGTPANLLDISGKPRWVYVVNQSKGEHGGGGFDEHKAILGIPPLDGQLEMARDTYLRNYERGWTRYSSITPITWAGFRRWATDQSRRGPKGGELTLSAAAKFDQEARDAVPEGQGAATQPGQTAPQRDLFTAPPIPGTTARGWSTFEVAVEEQRRVKLPKSRITNAIEAAFAFRELNRWPRERFQMIGVNARGKPVAFYDLFAGTISQTSVYPREIWTIAYNTPGVKGLWLAHNHPSGAASPSQADELLTHNIRQLLRPEYGIRYLGHVIIAADQAYSVEDGSRFTIPTHEPQRLMSVPVLERVMKRADKPQAHLTSPGAVRDYLRLAQPKESGLILLDAQHRAIGWWPIDVQRSQVGEEVADVLRMIGRTNVAAALLYMPTGKVEASAPLMQLKDLLSYAEVKLLDTLVAGENGSLLSFAERGIMQRPADYRAPRAEQLREIYMSPSISYAIGQVDNLGFDTVHAAAHFILGRADWASANPAKMVIDQATQELIDGWKKGALAMQKLTDAFQLTSVDPYEIPARGEGMHPDAVAWELKDHPVAKALGQNLRIVRRAVDLPERQVRKLIELGALRLVKGFVNAEEGIVHLVAENLQPGQAENTLVHEAVGHVGIYNVLPEEAGKDFRAAMLDIYNSRSGVIQTEVNAGFLREYGFDLRNPNHQMQAAAEYVAHMSELGEEQTLWQQLVAAVRAALRKAGFVKEWTENDIRRLFRLSRSSLENAGEDHFNGLPGWQLGERGPVWYSALERAVEKLDTQRASPEQWLATLKSRGAKPDEIYWSGLEEWLQHGAPHPKRLIERSAILAFLRDNGVKLSETMLGGVETGDKEMRALLAERDRLVVELSAIGLDVEFDQQGHLESVVDRASGASYYVNPERATDRYNLMPGEAFGLNDIPRGRRSRATLHASRLAEIAPTTAQFGNADIQGNTRHSNWKLPGGTDYRELLITLPVSANAGRPRVYDGAGGTVRGPHADFQSSHFDTPNIIAHVRFDTRTDADGKRVLFLEEIQSDWAEQGRERGFVTGPDDYTRASLSDQFERLKRLRRLAWPAAEVALIENDYLGFDNAQAAAAAVASHQDWAARWDVRDQRHVDAIESWALEQRSMLQVADRMKHPPGLARAPFVEKTPAWVGLVLKRTIRYAADHGFDRIAWTTGDQQVARYPIEHDVGEIHLITGDGRTTLTAYRKDSRMPILERDVSGEEEVAGIIGKELAARLYAAPEQTALAATKVRMIEGEQLKLGGHGMRQFYDYMLPNIANDVIRRFGGARVTTFKMNTGVYVAPGMSVAQAVNADQPGFEITPAMRESAAGGLPMFQLREQRGLSEVYGVKDGRVLGMASRPYGRGAWNVYLATGANETLFAPGQFTRGQAASIQEVQRMFNVAGLELRVTKPRNIPVPDRAIFDTSWVAPQADNWLKRTIIHFQNRLLLPELYEKAIGEQVGAVPEAAKAHREARIAHPRAAGKIADFDHDYSEPIVELMKQHRISIKDVGLYLYARHALERNSAIEEINPENKAGSGMTNERAGEVMTELVARYGERFEHVERIGQLADRINNFREEVLIDKGLATKEAVLLLREKYQHYVPLKELPDDDYVRGETGAGYKVGRLLNQAFGRFTEAQAEFILPGLVAQAKGTIAAGENAEVLRAFLRLVEYAPNPAVWRIKKEDFRPKIDRDTGMVVWAPRRPDNRNLISVPVDGQRVTVEVEDRGLANAFNTSGARLPETLSWVGAITRFYASMATAANPEFVMTNLLRDVQEAMIRVGGTQGPALAAKAAKDLPAAFWGAFSGLRAKGQYVEGESAKPFAEEWHGWYRRYIEAGGHIAYRGIQDAESQHKDFMSRLAEMGIYPEQATAIEALSARARRGARLVGAQFATQLVADINGAVENATRLAVFKNAVEFGLGDKEAAMIARNATVDFNLKGEATGIYNALYMFFNANVQGSALLLRSVAGSRGVRTASLALLALGLFLDWWNRQAADADESGRSHYDNISEDVKQRNLVIMGPDRKNAILIPLPFGFGIFHNIGRHMMAMLPKANGGAGEGVVDAARNTFVAAVNAFSPFGNVPQSWLGGVQLISPTFLDPPVQRMTNRNWMDKPIFPERRFGKPQSASETYYPGTPEHYVVAADWLNTATGGNEVRSGWADMYPNVMQHWVNSVFGSAGATYSRIFAWAVGKAVSDKQIETREIPFLRRFYYEPKDYELGHRFYDYVNRSEVAHYELEAALSAGQADKAATMRENFRGEQEVFAAGQLAERQVAQHARNINQIRRDKRFDVDQRKALIEKENEQRRQIMVRFTTQFEQRLR